MKVIFAAIILCFCIPVYAQNVNNRIDSIQKKLDTISQSINEKNYTRIPRNDFEEIIGNKIDGEIHSEMHEWQWALSVVLGVLGFLFLFYFKSQLKNEVNTSVEVLKKELLASVEMLKTDVVTLKTDISTNIDLEFKNRLGVFWDDLASSIIKRAEDHKYLGADIKISLEKLLTDKTIALQDNMKVQVIDALIYYYYYSDEKDKTQQMIKLVKNYENELYLTTQTYANLAIAFTNSYNLYGTKDDRTNAIEYCDKSINRLPDYGTAYALKLEVFIVYYTKGIEDEKSEAIKLIENTFHDIKNNGSENLPVEIIERLTLDKKQNFNNRGNYIITLEKMFISQLNSIRLRTIKYLMDNYSLVVSEETQRYLKILNSVLDYGLQNSPVIDGKWQAISYFKEGKENDISEIGEIKFANENYTSSTKYAVENGLVYFVPPEDDKPMALNLYEMHNDTVGNIKESIYQLDKDELLICYNLQLNERPLKFTSTAEDSNILITYKKIV